MKISMKREQNSACIGSAEREKFGAKLKTKNIFKALALAMLMPAMLLTTACSNDDDVVNNEPTAKKGYALPVTVNVTRGGDATRATYTDNGNGTGSLAFGADDKLFVGGNYDDWNKSFAGTLDYDAESGKFKGTIYTQDDTYSTYEALFAASDDIIATLLPDGYEDHGYLVINTNDPDAQYDDYIEESNEYTLATSKADGVAQFSYERATAYSSGFALSPNNAILNFTITGLAASTSVNVSLTSMAYTITGTVNTDASGTATFAAGIMGGLNLQPFSLTVGGKNITIVSSDKEVAKGKIYNITRGTGGTVDLSTKNTAYTAQNGETLTGTLASNVQISIADGATVILNNVNINGSGTWTSGDYAGITCEGNAEIILTGNNTVKGFQQDYSGISVPVNKTLTISGTGSLVVSSNGYGCGIGGRSYTQSGNITINGGTIEAWGGNGCAAIGGSRDGTCGDIIITNGTITAYGGSGSAGIGGGYNDSDGYQSTCGNISITGGTVEATGYNNVGIGGGYNGVCGDIIIANTVTQLKASVSNGDIASRPIGKGYSGGTSGTVTIGDIIYFDGSDFQNGGNSYLYHNPFTYHKLYTCNSSDWSSQISAFNAETGVDPILQLISDIPAITETFVISRSNGIIDLNGYTLGKIYLTNNTLNQSITLKNGTVKGDSYYDNAIDGYAGWNDFYNGTIILENLTVQQGIYTDGHEYIIRSGNYQNIYHCTKGSCPGKLVIYGGYFNKTIQTALPSSNAVFGTYELYGGKYAVRPNDSWCASGYSVKSNTDSDSGTYPWIVSAN